MFPSEADRVHGVFILDYVESASYNCDVNVLVFKEDEKASHHVWTIGNSAVVNELCIPRTRGPKHLRKLMYYVRCLTGALRFVRGLGDVDVIHAHGAALAGNLALIIGFFKKTPVVLTEHSGPFSKSQSRPVVRWLTNNAIRRSDMVCFVSKDLENQVLAHGVTPRRSVVTFNPVNTGLFACDNTSRENLVAFLGRLEPYKGALRTVKAWQRIAETYPDWTLVIVGDGPERTDIDGYLDENPALADRVLLLGERSKKEIADVFRRARVFVCPSLHETFGLVFAEAMSAGIPVVAPDVTAPPEFVDDRFGKLVDPGSVDEISQAISELIENQDQYDPVASHSYVEERFSLAAFSDTLIDVYRRVI